MSFLSDVFDFEAFNLKEMLKKIGDDPERLLIGAADPFSSDVWGKILGKDYEPIVDQWGGASADTYEKAAAAGIDIKAGGQMHDIARTIAQFYAGKWAKGKIGGKIGIGGSSGSGSSGSSGASGIGKIMSGDNLQNIGQGMQVFGQLFGAASDADQGRQSLRAAEYQAAQLRVNAGQAKAVAQREALNAEEQAKLVASRALAVAAASGGGATDPTVIRIISGIEEEGAYRKALALYEGEAMARELRMKASTVEYQGKLEKGAAGRSAFGGLLGGIAQGVSLFSKFGGGSPGSDTGPGSSSWGMDLGRG